VETNLPTNGDNSLTDPNIFDDAQTIIEIEIEDIGKVSILEVLNVGELISVEDTDTNRLISDELG
jgi:hypothetical protein